MGTHRDDSTPVSRGGTRLKSSRRCQKRREGPRALTDPGCSFCNATFKSFFSAKVPTQSCVITNASYELLTRTVRGITSSRNFDSNTCPSTTCHSSPLLSIASEPLKAWRSNVSHLHQGGLRQKSFKLVTVSYKSDVCIKPSRGNMG